MVEIGEWGLPVSAVEALQAVFSRHPAIEQVLIYGSRAKGNFRPGSDIDLTICETGLDWAGFQQVEAEIEELNLPYKVDLSLLRQIENEDLLDHIKRLGQRFFAKAQRSAP